MLKYPPYAGKALFVIVLVNGVIHDAVFIACMNKGVVTHINANMVYAVKNAAPEKNQVPGPGLVDRHARAQLPLLARGPRHSRAGKFLENQKNKTGTVDALSACAAVFIARANIGFGDFFNLSRGTL
jgi:hypothetical protein